MRLSSIQKQKATIADGTPAAINNSTGSFFLLSAVISEYVD
ncbi:MAG: hypothetical protein [Bacteriophage sp.]|nr:MAG: hypothetical protein [Bacteriophage sp.]